MRRPGAEELVAALRLEPLPGEGGFFRRTWVSPSRDAAGRPLGSAIYLLLTTGTLGFSAFHRLGTDEIYHFYAGDAVELHLLRQDGSHELFALGSDLLAGQVPQALAPAGAYQGSRLVEGGEWALLGTTMAPAFVEEDFELPERRRLVELFPAHRILVESLTRA